MVYVCVFVPVCAYKVVKNYCTLYVIHHSVDNAIRHCEYQITKFFSSSIFLLLPIHCIHHDFYHFHHDNYRHTVTWISLILNAGLELKCSFTLTVLLSQQSARFTLLHCRNTVFHISKAKRKSEARKTDHQLQNSFNGFISCTVAIKEREKTAEGNMKQVY